MVGSIETCTINKREINCNLMTVAAQVRVKGVGIGNLLKRLHETDFTEANAKAVLQVSQDLEEISTEDRRLLDLMDTETKKDWSALSITSTIQKFYIVSANQ